MRIISLILVTTAALGCSGESPQPLPTSPGPTPLSSFSGIWETEYRVVSCDSNRPWYCPARGSVVPLTLRVDDQGDTLSGYILEARGQSPVSGHMWANTASLQGRSTVVENSYQSVLEVREMLLSRPSADAMRGSFQLVHTTPTALLDIRGEIVRTIRHSPLPDLSDYSGTWRGNYLVRKCVSDTQAACRGMETEGTRESFELVIDAVERVVRVGTAAAAPLSGSVGSSGLNLFSQEIQRSDERLTITRLSAVRNRVGQLTGSFSYVVREPRSGGHVETMTVDVDLLDVVQIR